MSTVPLKSFTYPTSQSVSRSVLAEKSVSRLTLSILEWAKENVSLTTPQDHGQGTSFRCDLVSYTTIEESSLLLNDHACWKFKWKETCTCIPSGVATLLQRPKLCDKMMKSALLLGHHGPHWDYSILPF